MAFRTEGTLTPFGAPVKLAVIATNSIVVTELDSIKVALGFAALGTAGAAVYGHVVAIRTDKGVGFETDGTAGASTGSFVGTYTFPSNNQTVAKGKVELDISKGTIYSASVDATIGTTTGSNLRGYYIDLLNENTLDESTAAATTAQYVTYGLSKDDSTKAAVSIFESALI